MRLGQKLRLGRAVLEHRAGTLRHPVAVAWLVTGRCNRECDYCRWKALRTRPELDSSAAHRMVDEMADAGVLLISLSGGEPLLRRDIDALIGHVKARGLLCKVNSNGALVAEHVEALAAVDMLQISLDGPAEIADRHRGEGASSHALAAIDAAHRWGIPVQVVACLTAHNVEHVEDVVALAASLDAPIVFQPLAPTAGGEGARPTPGALLSAIDRLLALKGTHRGRGIRTTKGELRAFRQVCLGRFGGCDGSLVTATMFPDGGLVFCGNGRSQVPVDALDLGFTEAFSRLTVPECDGCTCAGMMRMSRLFELDPEVLGDAIRAYFR